MYANKTGRLTYSNMIIYRVTKRAIHILINNIRHKIEKN